MKKLLILLILVGLGIAVREEGSRGLIGAPLAWSAWPASAHTAPTRARPTAGHGRAHDRLSIREARRKEPGRVPFSRLRSHHHTATPAPAAASAPLTAMVGPAGGTGTRSRRRTGRGETYVAPIPVL